MMKKIEWLLVVLAMGILRVDGVYGLEPSVSVAGEDAGLVACYNFDEGSGETVKDGSGNHNDGKIKEARYVSLGEGKGFALRFDTDKASVDCGNGPGLDIRDAVTMEFWFYPENAPGTAPPRSTSAIAASWISVST